MANNPVSFFICTRLYLNLNDVEHSPIENAITNEKLVITTKSGNWSKYVRISRYPLNAANRWIETNEKEISDQLNREKINRKINMDTKESHAMYMYN
jgi:hypothetical protein